MKNLLSTHLNSGFEDIARLFVVLFPLAFLCLVIGCQESDDRILGDGLNTREQEQLNCSNQVRDAKISWRMPLQNPSRCTQGECIEMATDALVDQNGWFYFVIIARGRAGDTIYFTAATIDKMDKSGMTGGLLPLAYEAFSQTAENNDPSLGKDISYTDFTYLISIAPPNDRNKDERTFIAVIVENSLSKGGPFFRLYEMNNDTFERATLLAHVDNRNVVSIAHDAKGNIVVITSNVIVTNDSLRSAKSSDFRIAKYDPAGALLWEKELHGDPGWLPAIACDSQNNILLAHNKTGADNSALELKIGGSFLWLTKWNESGELLWDLEMDGSTERPGLAVDRTDNIILAAAQYGYDFNTEHGIISYNTWIGYVGSNGTLQKVYTTEDLFNEVSGDSSFPTSFLVRPDVHNLVVDRVGRIYIPITKRELTEASKALIAEWTPSLEPCSIASMQDDAPIRLYVSSDDGLYFSNSYSFGKIDR
jgi:hypothetical protein